MEVSSIDSKVISIIDDLREDHSTEIGLNQNLYTEIGLDSLQAVGILVEIERQFNVRIPEKLIPEISTPQLIINYVCENDPCK